jgi:hypothetical protein
MQITIELDSLRLEKLQSLEQTLKKTKSELIALAIDEVFAKITTKSAGKSAYALMLQSGFIGSFEGDANKSMDYKAELDWHTKT